MDPDENPTHSEYLSDLAASVRSSLMQMIADTADLLEVQSGSPVYQEALCHGQYCKESAKSFWVGKNSYLLYATMVCGFSDIANENSL